MSGIKLRSRVWVRESEFATGVGALQWPTQPLILRKQTVSQNQLRKTSHGRYFTNDSALPPKISGNQYAFNICSDSQRVCQFYCTYISFLLIRIRSSFPVLSRRMCFWMTCPMCPTIRIARALIGIPMTFEGSESLSVSSRHCQPVRNVVKL